MNNQRSLGNDIIYEAENLIRLVLESPEVGSEHYEILSKIAEDIISAITFFYSETEVKPDYNQQLILYKISMNCLQTITGRIINDNQSISNINITKNDDSNFVYIGKRKDSENEYKIGITNNLSQREKSLKTGSPNFQIVAILKTHNRKISTRIEKGLHGSFSDTRISGEWFKLTNEDVSWIIDQYGFIKQISEESE